MSHLLADVLPAPEQRVRLKDGAVTAAVGVVVHLVLLVGGVVPNLMALDLDKIPLLGASQNGLIHHIAYRLRKQGHNIDPHWAIPSNTWKAMYPSATFSSLTKAGTSGMR